MNRMILTGVVGVGMLFGCASTCPTPAQGAKTAASMGVVNSTCVMNPSEGVSPDAPTSTWKGQKVGYCCKGCKAKFEALSDADKDTKVAAAIARNAK